MSIGFNAGLVIAQLDLNLVRLLRQAMAPKNSNNDRLKSVKFEQRQVIHPEPRIEPRRVYHPNPTYAPRLVKPEQKLNPVPAPACDTVVIIEECPHRHEPVLEAPWKKIPWKNPPEPARIVKVFKTNPDDFRKGTIIDCFL